jgi:signal transduction histidine kinase
MGALVDSLLRLARAGEGDSGGWPTMDVGALAAAAIDRCRVLGDRDWQLAAENGARVCGDGAALEQVVVNLLSNAVRHTSAGDSIAVQVEPVGDRVEVRVIDSGEGIDPELRSSLFDRFTRADSARSRDTGGAGLGLAICHAIVTAHGGTIAARDTPSGGATFVVSLPQAGARPRDGEIRVVSPPAHA